MSIDPANPSPLEKDTTDDKKEQFAPRKSLPTSDTGQPSASHAEDPEHADKETSKEIHRGGKRELLEDDCYDKLGFCFPWYKKWAILSVIFAVQMSMNFNTDVYANAVTGITEEFGICAQAARIPCAVVPNFGTIVVCRFLGGISSAGGSVTLGMTADMWEANDQGYAVAYVVLSSVGGSTIGPFFGGIIGEYLSWHWVFWVQLIFGGFTQALHFLIPETRATILIDREARRRRKNGEDMFLREPIVLFLSLLSGFSDALIFVFIESFTLVFTQWGFSTLAVGMSFGSILIGYLIAYFMFFPEIWRQQHIPQSEGFGSRLAERRLLLLLFICPLEPIGLLGFAWTTMGPEYSPWIAPCIFACLIAMANYAIYMATIDYMVAAYGPYSASATGGNGFARDFLAGIATMYSTPMYENIGGRLHLQWASTLLGCIGVLVMIPIYVFYWKGPAIRARSKFAQTLEADRQQHQGRRSSYHKGY
ncbi:hypothetical protein SI65_01975 [Aspergillus cristatus]|uniref:Major facilitator superfamily (MFS) profile domain-containing protein n=1 Tax=Aspergillus cristatus TaxID=573508 RepID=A0A1E3BTV9_ASPCR|nr:hypothetical protein SI65_01907 [Aspergillus cristatus]ODM24385.1 hypothetical protein SI65_01975 [Aspergillus cristatus]